VRRFGSRKLAIGLGFLQSLALTILALSPSLPVVIALVAFTYCLPSLIAYQFDLLLEAPTEEEEHTGRVRTLFLTATNLALVGAPLATGFLLAGGDEYPRIFLLASLALGPFLALFLLEKFPDAEPPVMRKVRETCMCIWADPDLRATALASLVLR